MSLEIIYQDDDLAVINKPHGLAVHASAMIGNTDTFALQMLRDQLQRHVYPAHRIDRKTSGILVFALNKEMLSEMEILFRERRITKTYQALVRGFTEDSGRIDHPLENSSGQLQEALTDYRCLKKFELPLPFGKHSTSRYSLLEINLLTGRMHQIRRHMNHLRHPIIGDRPHGCNKQNRLFKEHFNLDVMLLHA
jgi:tRNA pseudouridine65 synthase